MGEPRRVFISHNSKNDPVARAFLNHLVAAIRDEKTEAGTPLFEVLVDTDLAPGYTWRGPLYTWMLLCDTAVLLLDQNTIDSTWVPREAMIFNWRRQLDQKFHLLPILRGVDKTIFRSAPFVEMGLEDLGNMATDDPAKIVEVLRKETTPSSDRRFRKLEGYLRANDPDAFQTSFEEAQEILALGAEWSFLKTFRPAQALAAALLGLGFRAGPYREGGIANPSAHALLALSDWLTTKGNCRQICDILSSYWVAREVGADLYRAVQQHGVIGVRLHLDERGWDARFVEAHLAEAFSQNMLVSPQIQRIPAVRPGNGMEDEVTAIEHSVRDVLWAVLEPGTQWSARDEPRFARAYSNPSGPAYFFWAVDRDPFLLDSFVQVQRRMPYIRLIYLSTVEPSSDHDDVYWLNTNLDPNAEQTVLTDTDAAKVILRGLTR